MLAARRIKGEQLILRRAVGRCRLDSRRRQHGANPHNASSTNSRVDAGEGADADLTGPGGALVLPFWHRTAFLKLPLPQRMDVEFRLRSKDTARFSIRAGRAAQPTRCAWKRGAVNWCSRRECVSRASAGSTRRNARLPCAFAGTSQTQRCEVYTPEGRLLKNARCRRKSPATGRRRAFAKQGP